MIIRQRNFQLILIVAILPVLGTTMLSPILDSLIGPFDTTPARIGLMISLFSAPAIFLSPFAGVLADRYGRKPLLISSILLFGVSGIAISFTTTFHVALSLRLVQGIGIAGVRPLITTVIGDIFADSRSREAAGQGLRLTIGNIAGIVLPVTAGILVVVAWHYPFFLYALALPIAFGVFFWFDEPTGTTHNTSDTEPYFTSLLRLISHPRVLILLVGLSLPYFVWIGFVTYNSIIVISLHGGTAPQAGIYVGVWTAIAAIAATQVGRITSAFSNQIQPLIITSALLGGGFLIFLFAPSPRIAILGLCAAGAGGGTTFSMYRSLITGLPPMHLRATLVSISSAAGQLTTTLTPLLLGGIIAIATPIVGFTSSIQLAGLTTAILGGGGSIACLLIARILFPAQQEPTRNLPKS
jgi:MFS family permease